MAAQIVREAAQCPDCSSRVRVAHGSGRIQVAHDHGCPALRSLRAQGRQVQAALLRGPDQTAEAFRADVTALVSHLAADPSAVWPGAIGVRVATHPYAGLDFTGSAAPSERP